MKAIVPSYAAAAAAKSLQSCPTLLDPKDCSLPGSPSMGFSKQEYWSGLPLPSPVPSHSHLFLLCSTYNIFQSLNDKIQVTGQSVSQLSRSVVSDSLRPHGPQHARPPCPSQLPELAQTHVHRVGDAIQPSHPQFITTSVSPFYLPWSNGGFPGGLAIKNLPAKLDTQEMLVQSLGWENPLEGHDNPLQYSCLDSSMDRLARWSTICWVIKNQTWLKWLSANVARCHNLSFLNI